MLENSNIGRMVEIRFYAFWPMVVSCYASICFWLIPNFLSVSKCFMDKVELIKKKFSATCEPHEI